MVVLSKPTIDHHADLPQHDLITLPSPLSPAIPTVDLSQPHAAKHLIVSSCEEFGFFKVVNHGVPPDLISRLEDEAVRFFSLPLSQKQKGGLPDPLGYGNKRIGPNGDIGWIEYLLLAANNPQLNSQKLTTIFGKHPDKLCSAMNEYVSAMKKMACELLELMADGLNMKPRNVFSKLLSDEESDSVFRLNNYPPCPENGKNMMIGFGEHTDPQIISVLRSNSTSGLQISLRNGTWISVPPDPNSFFINVGDSLQVMTNGRFKSVKHRVVANSCNSRISMIYFGGPALNQKIAPLLPLVNGSQKSLYNEFTWFEYKKSAYKSRLGDNRLAQFTRI